MNNQNLPIPVGEEKIVYKGKLFEVVEQTMKAGDREFHIELVRRPPGTRLIIVSEDKKILLTQEYRIELKDWDIRLPGGKVFDSSQEYNEFLKSGKDITEKAAEAAKKEAHEEAGLEVEEMQYFLTSHCGVSVIWDLYFFVVTKYQEHADGQKLEVGENIKLKWISFTEARTLCLEGKIREDRSVAVLLKYLQ